MRTGVLAKKVGMTRVFNQNRVHNSVTVLHLPSSIVLGHRKVEKDGYNALVLGFEKVKTKNINKPQKEFFSKIKQEPTRKIKEFRVSEENFVNQGSMILNIFPFTIFSKPLLTNYLDSVTLGLKYYAETGNIVSKNQFGKNIWFS